MAGVNPIPEGCEGILPHLIVDGCAKAIDFYKKAFGAEEVLRIPGPGGKLVHAEIRIGSSLVYLADDTPEFCDGKAKNPKALGATPVVLHQYVTNVDAALDRAAKAGGTILGPATDMFWGDRYGRFRDPFGHEWSLASHQKDLTPEQMEKASREFIAGMAAGKGKPKS
jgi:uncharacterized glyoxalase superfamily protein PhnB